MKEYLELSVFSTEDAKNFASKDAKLCSKPSDYQKYVEENTLSYYVLSNTWVLLIKRYCPRAWVRFAMFLKDKGIINCIKLLQDEADLVTHERDYGNWTKIFLADLQTSDKEVVQGSLIGMDRIATVLFLLRYPKRFSPSRNTLIQELTIRDFFAYENRTKLLQRKSSYARDYVCSLLREYISKMYPWNWICKQIRTHKYDWIRLSDGVSVDSKQSLGDKIMTCLRSGKFNSVSKRIFQEKIIPSYPTSQINEFSSDVRLANLRAVPKSYKSSRIIAIDSTVRLAQGSFVESLFRDIDHRRRQPEMDLEDQTVNQRLAQEGSISGEITTIDASHASDLISRSLFVDIFPPEYVSLVSDMMPNYLSFDGSMIPLQMSSTSGNALTFRHETIVYKAVVACAEKVVQDVGIPVTPHAWAYGDDSLINTIAYPVAEHFFSVIGLKINPEKSFSSGGFRESCGKDYMYGRDVTSLYYPRFPIIGAMSKEKVTLSLKDVRHDTWRNKTDNSISMLIDLEKKLFPHSYDAARLISSLVQTAYPAITTSVAGSICPDLWDYVDTGRTTKLPSSYARVDLGLKPLSWEHRYGEKKISSLKDVLTDEAYDVFLKCHIHDTYHVYPAIRIKVEQPKRDNKGNPIAPYYSKTEYVQLYEYWKYRQFLRFGPSYEDPLLELLGISSKPISLEVFYGKTEMYLTRK